MFHRGNEALTAPAGDAFTTPVSRTNANSELSSNLVSNVEEIHSHYVPSSRASTEPTILSNSVEETNMVDIEHPLMLSGDREIPFTYLASLSAKWAAVKEKSSSVCGRIKVGKNVCFHY